ncbi:MAG: galactose ABC transporter substrate-binding protein [Sarcina sp.]
MKKIFLIFMSFIASILCGCYSSNTNEKTTIGISVYDGNDVFISDIIGELQNKVTNLENIKIEIISADNNQFKQNDDIDSFIKNGVDILCINIVDRRSASTLINKAKKANVPIIFFNREPVYEDMVLWDKAYYIGAVAKDSAIMQSEIVSDIWKDKRKSVDKNNDEKIQYVVLEGELGHQDSIIRSKYCVKELENLNIDCQRVANIICNWSFDEAYKNMNILLGREKNIEVIFSNNDAMALGAIKAFKDLEVDIPIVVGVDGIKEAIYSIEEGELYGTIINNSMNHANSMYKLITKILNNEVLDHEKYIWISQTKVIRE